MGYYINPESMSKEEWLTTHGEVFSLEDCRNSFKQGSSDIPVCLVDNGWMTAAGICYSAEELEAFAHPDGRPKKWYLVAKELLMPYCNRLAE
jgi:hypothetical protein